MTAGVAEYRPGLTGYLVSTRTSNLRHRGDAPLHRTIEARFETVASLELSNKTEAGTRRRVVVVHKQR